MPEKCANSSLKTEKRTTTNLTPREIWLHQLLKKTSQSVEDVIPATFALLVLAAEK